MDLHNSFAVPADLDAAWDALLDVQRMAPCMPGATLEGVAGDEFAGNVKVKLGPVSIVYAGKAQFVSKDDASHVAVIRGTGKETRGTGSAKALVTVRLTSESSNLTRVEVTTELTITGKAAQFGRGVMQDVAGRIIDQFAANLSALMGESRDEPTDEGGAASATDSIDLLGAASLPVLKRAVPFAVGAMAVIAIIWWLVER
jgi:carbon monoxide dehydrogenase subunit G